MLWYIYGSHEICQGASLFIRFSWMFLASQFKTLNMLMGMSSFFDFAHNIILEDPFTLTFPIKRRFGVPLSIIDLKSRKTMNPTIPSISFLVPISKCFCTWIRRIGYGISRSWRCTLFSSHEDSYTMYIITTHTNLSLRKITTK